MVEKKVTIVNKTGLHACPANGLVNLVKKYNSRINLIKDNKTANPKSIINVLTLDLNQGAEVLVRAEGGDEEEALDAVVTYLAGLTE
ncbi:MAG: HPr family phosphocarrier protein [Clostridiales bacterium]|nr:HPr family phosphocarrier protein [Clostridiales bacterium]